MHMRRVNLSGALLTYAWFKQCDLTEAVTNGDTDVFGISYDRSTRWPSGFTPPPSRVDVDDGR